MPHIKVNKLISKYILVVTVFLYYDIYMASFVATELIPSLNGIG